MAIIKLTQKYLDIEAAFEGREAHYKNLETFINTKNILYFNKTEEGASVYLAGGRGLYVKETPEEILALIKDAEIKEHTSCNNNNIREARRG